MSRAVRFLKMGLKRRLPPELWHRLVRVKGWVVNISSTSLVSVISSFLKLLPVPLRIALRNEMGVIRKLDYERHAIYLHVDSRVEYQVRINSGQREPETIAWIDNSAREGDVLFDIGANVGAYALVAAKSANGKIKVYAFEPAFPTFHQLSRNILLNCCYANVIPLQVALSDTTRLDWFNYSNLSPGKALHSFGSNVDQKGQTFEPILKASVLGFRLDDLVRYFGIEVPNLVKLDVDGAELSILRGATQTLADRALRTILVEMEEDSSEELEIVELLNENGFELKTKHRYVHGQVSGRFSKSYNYIFVRT